MIVTVGRRFGDVSSINRRYMETIIVMIMWKPRFKLISTLLMRPRTVPVLIGDVVQKMFPFNTTVPKIQNPNQNEKIQERALRFLHNDHFSSYGDLLSKSERCTMHVSRLRVLCIEVFKTLKNLNPSFMQDIFKIKSSRYSLRKSNDLQHYRPNQVTFGSNSLRSLGPQTWNGLPNEIKTA